MDNDDNNNNNIDNPPNNNIINPPDNIDNLRNIIDPKHNPIIFDNHHHHHHHDLIVEEENIRDKKVDELVDPTIFMEYNIKIFL